MGDPEPAPAPRRIFRGAFLLPSTPLPRYLPPAMHPILFTIAGKPFYTYGFLAMLGFLAAIATWAFLSRRRPGWPAGLSSDLGALLLLAGILGARLAYVLANLPDFIANPAEIVRIDHGGLIFYGGLLLASLALVLFARIRRLPLWALADFAIPGLAVGHALGRIGCYCFGCCYGCPARAIPSLGVVYPLTSDVGAAHPGIPLYPVQLAEAAALLLLWLLLVALYLRPAPRRRPGVLFAIYLLLYPPVRFALEFLRGDPRQPAFAGLDVAQLLSLLLFAVGIALLFLLPRANPFPPTAAPTAPQPGSRPNRAA